MCHDFSLKHSHYLRGFLGGREVKDNREERTGELTVFPEAYLFLMYFLIMPELKVYEYLGIISYRNAYDFIT